MRKINFNSYAENLRSTETKHATITTTSKPRTTRDQKFAHPSVPFFWIISYIIIWFNDTSVKDWVCDCVPFTPHFRLRTLLTLLATVLKRTSRYVLKIMYIEFHDNGGLQFITPLDVWLGHKQISDFSQGLQSSF